MNDFEAKTSGSLEPSLRPETLPAGIYAELRRLAIRRMGGARNNITLQPTMLAHDAWLRLTRSDRVWHDQRHFLATASTAMRQILVDHARKKSRLRRGGPDALPAQTLSDAPAPVSDENLLRLDEGVTALEKINAVRAQVVIARFFGGLTTPEIAAQLQIGERSVERHWASAKVWLLRWMQGAATGQETA